MGKKFKEQTEMKVKEQVISLYLAKKLKELGIKQKSLFYYVVYSESKFDLLMKKEKDKSFGDKAESSGQLYSAFTAPELGEFLPLTLDFIDERFIEKNYTGHHRLITWKGVDGWWVGYIPFNCTFEDFKAVQVNGEDWRIKFWGEKEADARAKMLIWLIENGWWDKRKNFRRRKNNEYTEINANCC